MKTKKLPLFILALLLCLSFAACNNTSQIATPAADGPTADSAETPVAIEPIKIGHIVDLTGVQAMTGEEAKRALEFAIDALGGEFAGRPVEIIVSDAQDQPSVAVDVAKKMVEVDGVSAIFGPTQPGQKSAVAEYMATVGIPLIFYNATPSTLMMGNDWLVGSGGSTPQLPTVMADYVYNELGYVTINTVSMDNVGFRSFVDPFVDAFKKLGGTVLTQQWAPIPCADWAPYLVNLEDADAIVAWASGSDAISLWSAWYEMGFNEKMPMVAPHHGGFTDYFVPTALSNNNPAAAEAMLGALAPILYVYDIQTPENEAFVDAWTAKFGSVPANNLPGSCYQAALLLKTAVESINGDTTPDKLIKAVFEADVVGPEGRLFFDNSNVATKDVYIVKVVKLDDGSYNYAEVKTYKNVAPEGFGN
jgi:branched-chain amino acid transport system substrate-binding protein